MRPRFPFIAVRAAMFIAAFSALVLTSVERSFAQAPIEGTNGAAARQAIIVIRHGVDHDACVVADPKKGALSETWKAVAPNWPAHNNLPPVRAFKGANKVTDSIDATTTVKTFQHCLSPVGEQQALRLRDELPAIVTAQNIAPVSRVIVINPQIDAGGWATANPFDTVLPFIVKYKDSITSILLLANNGCEMVGQMSRQLRDLADAHTLIDAGGGSTLVCWTGEGLNENVGDQRALLDLLNSQSIKDEINNKRSPCVIGEKGMGYDKGKGNALYILTPRPYSAKTDANGKIGGATEVNKNCEEQKYDLLVYQAMRKATLTAADNGIGDFQWTHKFVVHELPPDSSPTPSIFVTREFVTPADNNVFGGVESPLQLSH